jgi:hypothetical protein
MIVVGVVGPCGIGDDGRWRGDAQGGDDGGRVDGRSEFVGIRRESRRSVGGRRRLADVAVKEGGHRGSQLGSVVGLLLVGLGLGRGGRDGTGAGARIRQLPRRRRHGQALHWTDGVGRLLVL